MPVYREPDRDVSHVGALSRLRRTRRDAARGLGALFALAVRPHLWWVAVRQAARMARPRWWRRAPFLPLPDADYLRFRLETAYGAAVTPRPSDLVAYLEWCGDLPRARSRKRL